VTEAALPVVEQSAEASAQQPAEQPADQTAEAQQEGGEQAEKPAAAEKTPEQRALERAERKIGRLVRQREELRAQLTQGLRTPPIESDNRPPEADSEPLQLSRAELQELIKAEAAKLAPTIKQQQDGIEQRAKLVEGLSKEWGSEKFDSLARDLNEAFDGLTDTSGKPKAATDAIFESDDPKGLIEYLANPDNADEAEQLSRLTDRQLGRAIARLEMKVAAQKKSDKPQPSKVPAPVETGRGQGSINRAPDPANTKAWIKWANEREAKGLL
jgi:hypothetical protein